jgi:FKBP-type peptidyl-prolyl cis-trans isomerase 2
MLVYFQQCKLNPGPFVFIAILLCSLNVPADEPPPNTIGPGKIVSLSYTVSLPDGEVVHSNVDGAPLKYKQGDGKLLPALEAALGGLAAGDEKSVTLPPEDTYPINDDAFQEVPLDQIPEDSRQVGAVFRPMGSRGSIRVAEIKEDKVVLDFNHPLAGKTLTYDVTILSVE